MTKRVHRDSIVPVEPAASLFSLNSSQHDPTMDDLKGLTQDDKLIIRQSWDIIQRKKDAVARKVFIFIFKQCPETKALFHFTPNKVITTKSMENNMAFDVHAMRFIQIIQNSVEKLDEHESLAILLTGLGQFHARLSKYKGFQSHFWTVFIESVILVFRKELKGRVEDMDKTIVIWRFLLRIIIRTMKNAFFAKLQFNKTHDRLMIAQQKV